ncbi:putative holliday junction resolvase [Acetobacter senegalensis]|uniref:Putative pre-16S rRNA nuclease n=2 Tax=Acetobacter senegalensis TaxID=446692 RepID=A0A0U5FNM1_9PROT|nr:putative holliday junction resolvase [Acetobacter senegalensis]
MACMCAVARSRAENLRAARPVRASVRVSPVSILFNNLGYSVEGARCFRRAGQNGLTAVSVCHHIFTLAQGFHLRAHHGGHALNIHLGQLINPAQNAIQLLADGFKLSIFKADAGQFRNTSGGREVKRHESRLSSDCLGEKSPSIIGRKATYRADMALLNLTDLTAALARNDRLLGIDPGRKQVGLALSDVSRMVATPLETVKRGKLGAMATHIRTLADRHGIGGMVIGIPLSLDGSFGPAAQAAKDWAMALSDQTGLPVCLWDERLSSSAVNRMLIQEADLSRKKREGVVDQLAAAYILQAALDSIPRPALF